jgi:hypothetical protein
MSKYGSLDNGQGDIQRDRFAERFGANGLGYSDTARTNALFPATPILEGNRITGQNDRGSLFDVSSEGDPLKRAFANVVDPINPENGKSISVNGHGFYGNDKASLNYGKTPAVVVNDKEIADNKITVDNEDKATWMMYPDIRSRSMESPSDEPAGNLQDFPATRTESFGSDKYEDREASANPNSFGVGTNNEADDTRTIGMYFSRRHDITRGQ